MAEHKTRRLTLKLKPSQFKCLYERARKLNVTWSEYVRDLIIEDCKK